MSAEDRVLVFVACTMVAIVDNDFKLLDLELKRFSECTLIELLYIHITDVGFVASAGVRGKWTR